MTPSDKLSYKKQAPGQVRRPLRRKKRKREQLTCLIPSTDIPACRPFCAMIMRGTIIPSAEMLQHCQNQNADTAVIVLPGQLSPPVHPAHAMPLPPIQLHSLLETIQPVPPIQYADWQRPLIPARPPLPPPQLLALCTAARYPPRLVLALVLKPVGFPQRLERSVIVGAMHRASKIISTWREV